MMNLSSLSKTRISLCFGVLISFIVTVINLFEGKDSYTALLMLIPLVGAMYFLERSRREIIRTTNVCKALTKGDFTSRVTHIHEKGDLGEFQWSVNEMTDYTDAFIREATASMLYVSRNQYFRRILEDGLHGDLLAGARIINKATEGVALKMAGFKKIAYDVDESLGVVAANINKSVSTLQTTAENMVSTVTLSRTGANAAVQKSDVTSQNVQTISAAAEEMSSAVAEISQQVARTSRISTEAVSKTEDAKRTMDDLVQASQKINEVLQIIEDIAAQTNLLALNATIEAARAGDAGKGFAVVASEVKQLAGQTSKATEEVKRQITNIQNATNDAARAFSGVGTTIAEINESTTIVAAAIEEQSAASREIAASAEQASNGTIGMANDVRGIDQGMQQVDRAAQDVTTVTDTLSVQATKHVVELLEKMNVFMNELKKIA